jgi:hypothetical protein
VPAQQNSAIKGSHTASRAPRHQEIKPEKELRREGVRLSYRGGSGPAGQDCAQVTFVGVELALDEDRALKLVSSQNISAAMSPRRWGSRRRSLPRPLKWFR